MSKISLAAIDLGFGNSKYSAGFDAKMKPHYDSFPSVVNPVSKTQKMDPLMEDRNSVIVKVEDSYYEVGPDAHITKNKERILHEDYVNHPHYAALMKGCLFYIGASKIDVLVLGLPVSMGGLKEVLREKFTGVIEVTDAFSVTVGKVLVLDQPYGSLIYYSSASQDLKNNVVNSVNLVLDPGYFTFDWLTAVGLKKDKSRSDSYNSGISSILIEVANAFGADHGIQNYRDLDNIDRGLRTGFARLYGKDVPMERYYPLVSQMAQKSVNAMQNQVGNDLRDVDNIILSGGGSHLYAPALKSTFPHHSIITMENALYSNLVGYLIRGALWMEGAK